MAGTADRDLPAILASAAAGDEVAFGRIVTTYDDEMYRVCVAVCRDLTVAADAVQAAWSIAWRKLGSVREPDRLRSWLISVAVNEGKKQLKKRNRRSEVEYVGEIADQRGGVDPTTGIDTLDLISALERLDADDRALLALRYMAGFDATELSTAIGISPAAVRQRLKRLVDRLRTELE
jgi:RNA polymerase sigma factor (sigma-70 family)